MRMIYRIAKKELQILFYSPVAWFLLVVFAIQTALVFTGKYEEFLFKNEWQGAVQMMASMASFNRLWGAVLEYLYYYIPLLTMGLVSRELSSGSIKLLYSSPVTNSQIILGKFLSMVAYAGVMSAILLIYVIVGWCTIKDFEFAAVMTGWLGLFLLTCTYAAVGIFISSLTSYQFVAAVGTFIMLMLLSMVSNWGQEYDLIRDVTYWLGIGGRTGTFIGGMICSEDLLYFPLVIAMFLTLTIVRLNAVRQKVRFIITFGKNMGVILLTCFVGYLSSRPKLMAYYDATSNKRNTLCLPSQEIMKQLEGGLTITAYSNILSPYYNSYAFPRFVLLNRELFKPYERFKPEIKLKTVFYYDSITPEDDLRAAASFKLMGEQNPGASLWERAKKMCETYHMDSMLLKSLEEIREVIDLTGERTFVWEIARENGQRVWLRSFDTDPFTPYPYETETTAVLKRFLMKTPKIGCVEGYGMRSILDLTARGYAVIAGDKKYRQSLLNQGFDAVSLDLSKDIPEDIDILTMADMREELSSEEEQVLARYIERGGNLFILAEPRRRDVMNPFLSKYFGVELIDGILMQYRWEWMNPDNLYCRVTPEAKELSFYFDEKQMWYVMMPTAGGLEKVADKGFKYTPILRSDTIVGEVQKKEPRPYIVWNELGEFNFEAGIGVQYNPELGEVAKEYHTAVALSRMVGNKEQRIIITGDADCISNNELGQNRSPNNGKMILGTYNYLSYNEMPIETKRKPTTDTAVYLNRTGFNILYVGFQFIFPLLFLTAGVFVWLWRRGK